MNSSWIDYYRCPQEFASFCTSAELGPKMGFFNFGRDITCFGRSAGPVAPAPGGDLGDALPLLQAGDSGMILPFDVDEVFENLRGERYVASQVAGGSSGLAKSLIRNAYYAARPYLSVSVRKHFQRFHLRGWKDIGFPAWPVDKTIDNLCAELMALSVRANGDQKVPFIWFWPDGRQGCVLITHDIEHEPGRVFCKTLMDVDETHGVHSSFQVVPEERYPVTQSFLESIRNRGFEINVHDLNHDGHLFEDHDEFLRRAVAINRHAKLMGAEGFRSGAMYRNPEWIQMLDLSYDMSVPNSAHLEPQKGGCCTVMPYFAGKLVEIPLTATQDYSLLHILGQYSIDLWKQEIDVICSSYGLISFDVHPDYVIDHRARAVYESLLRYLIDQCAERHLWQPLPCEVARWWRERSQMQIFPVGDSWKIVGPGAERARLAYAQLDKNALSYIVEASPCPAAVS